MKCLKEFVAITSRFTENLNKMILTQNDLDHVMKYFNTTNAKNICKGLNDAHSQ